MDHATLLDSQTLFTETENSYFGASWTLIRPMATHISDSVMPPPPSIPAPSPPAGTTPVKPKLPNFATRRAACTHVNMDRIFGDIPCSNCARVPDTRILYCCAQDHGKFYGADAMMAIFDPDSLDPNGRRYLPGEEKLPTADLAPWMEAAIARGEYTEEQVHLVHDQKRNVVQATQRLAERYEREAEEERKTRRESVAKREKANLKSNTVPPSPSSTLSSISASTPNTAKTSATSLNSLSVAAARTAPVSVETLIQSLSQHPPSPAKQLPKPATPSRVLPPTPTKLQPSTPSKPLPALPTLPSTPKTLTKKRKASSSATGTPSPSPSASIPSKAKPQRLYPYCTLTVCGTCRPTYRDRSWVRIEDALAVPDHLVPTLSTLNTNKEWGPRLAHVKDCLKLGRRSHGPTREQSAASYKSAFKEDTAVSKGANVNGAGCAIGGKKLSKRPELQRDSNARNSIMKKVAKWIERRDNTANPDNKSATGLEAQATPPALDVSEGQRLPHWSIESAPSSPRASLPDGSDEYQDFGTLEDEDRGNDTDEGLEMLPVMTKKSSNRSHDTEAFTTTEEMDITDAAGETEGEIKAVAVKEEAAEMAIADLIVQV